VPESPLVLQAKFSSWLGWSQPFLYRLLQGIRSACRVAVLCQRIENLDRFPIEDYVCASSRALLRPSMASVCAAYIRAAFDPSLIHAHFGWSGIRVLLLRELLGVPLVTTFGGRDVCTQMVSEQYAPLYRLLLERSSRLVCVSEDLRARLEDAGVDPRRLRTIRRGTDTELFASCQREGPAAGEALRLLMIGRLAEKKGHGSVFRAMARLAAEGVPAALRILGSGDYEGSLRRQAQEAGVASRIEWLRPCDSNGVVKQLHWAHVFLHPSVTSRDGDREGIPNVVVEAASTGLPVVATRHGGIPEVVEDGVTGLLVPERDCRALAGALARLSRSQAMRRRMGEAGARRARTHFSFEHQIAQHLALYEEVREEASRWEVAPLPTDFVAMCRRVFVLKLDHSNLHVARYVAGALARQPADGSMLWQAETAGPPVPARGLPPSRWIGCWRPARAAMKVLLGPARGPLVELWRRRFGDRLAREQVDLDQQVEAALRSGRRLHWEDTLAAYRAASFVLRAQIGTRRAGWASR
jgi:colanic acid/amylovoran biosynthesis glycosyltransferase